MAAERLDNYRSVRSLLTLEEVAGMLRVSKTTVYRLVERREIPCWRVGRSLRFAHEDLTAYLRARRVGSAALDEHV